MSRLDRLVRSVGPRMDDAEVLVASVLGHRADGRGHVALVATDRRLLLVTEGFTRTMIDEFSYGDVTDCVRTSDAGTTALEIVATDGRWRVERIDHEPSTLVALGLIERRCQAGDSRPRPPAPVPHRVRVLTSDPAATAGAAPAEVG